MDIKKSVGRPKLGETRKISLTLPSEIWEYIDKYQFDNPHDKRKVSSAIRDMLEKHYGFLMMEDSQIDIYQAILNAQAINKNLTV